MRRLEEVAVWLVVLVLVTWLVLPPTGRRRVKQAVTPPRFLTTTTPPAQDTVPIISGGIVYDPERLAGEVEDYLRSLR